MGSIDRNRFWRCSSTRGEPGAQRHVHGAWPRAVLAGDRARADPDRPGAGDVGMRPAQGEDLAARGAKRADRSGVIWYGVGSLLTSGAVDRPAGLVGNDRSRAACAVSQLFSGERPYTRRVAGRV